MPLSRNLPKNSHVLWLISLIQDTSPESQTKDEFEDMTEEIIKNNAIDKITLCVADNLQRFRFMIQHDCTESEGIEKCQQLSRQWHTDNAQSLEKLKEKKNLSFLKWDDFIAWPDYAKTVKAVEELYVKEHKFKRDVDGRIRQEIEKLSDNSKITDPIKQAELLKKYLFEESAFQKFVASRNFRFELYKNSFPPAAKRIISNTDFVPPGFLSEIHFTQYNKSPKHNPMQQDNVVQFHDHADGKHSFSNVLSQSKSSSSTYHEKPRDSSPTKSQTHKTAEFIASAIELLPLEVQESAWKKLIDVTIQEIMPLYYKPAIPVKTQ